MHNIRVINDIFILLKNYRREQGILLSLQSQFDMVMMLVYLFIMQQFLLTPRPKNYWQKNSRILIRQRCISEWKILTQTKWEMSTSEWCKDCVMPVLPEKQIRYWQIQVCGIVSIYDWQDTNMYVSLLEWHLLYWSTVKRNNSVWCSFQAIELHRSK